MQPFDYTFIFGEIGDKPTLVQFLDHQRDIQHQFAVAINHRDAFRSVAPSADIERASDAFSIAAAVYAADWLSVRRTNSVCRIRVVMPVWRRDLFENSAVLHHLSHLLRLYTGDEWYFEWQQRTRSESYPVSQVQMEMLPAPEVALWSGGLDSLGGWWKRYRAHSADAYVLVGSGANDCILGVQRQLHHEASDLSRQLRSVPVELAQISLHLTHTSNLRKESSQRSRGFVFTLVGAACAYLRGQQFLHIYENGVGAINLPYCAAEIGLDHARSVHPSSLFEMSRLVTTLFDAATTIWNPFVFETKAQLCEPLTVLNEIAPWSRAIATSFSCDSPHRQLSCPAQCGYCPSCLLRRQSLAANGIEDETRYTLSHRTPRASDSHALRAMLHQVSSLQDCLQSDEPWRALQERFPQIVEALSPTVIDQAGSIEAAQQAFIELYGRYCHEWGQVEERLAWGLLSGSISQRFAA